MSTRRSAAIASVVVLAAACSSANPGSLVVPSPTSTPVTTSPAASASPSLSPPPSTSTASPARSPSASAGIDPADFAGPVDNPWFPLIPGTIWTSIGTKDGKKAIDVFEVTAETRVLAGVTCVVVRDRLTLDGVLEERTVDYYTQDLAGNVWYFGEDTAELDEAGKVVSTEGSWHAGVDGAVPGIYMEASPTVGHEFVQEFYKGHAEDHFRVKDLKASVSVPFGSFTDVVLTEEWTPLEPDVLDNKYYVRGLGQVREVAVKGPTEELLLKDVQRP